jgi:hypothetical protein
MRFFERSVPGRAKHLKLFVQIDGSTEKRLKPGFYQSTARVNSGESVKNPVFSVDS